MEQTVFITGGGRGLGLTLTARFLRSGFRVFAGVRGDSSALDTLRLEFPESAEAVTIDVSDVTSIRRAVEVVSGRLKSLDILITNAAVNIPGSEVKLEDLDLSDGTRERTFSVNAFGPLRVTQLFLALLEKGEGKTIVNISSEAGSAGRARFTARDAVPSHQ